MGCEGVVGRDTGGEGGVVRFRRVECRRLDVESEVLHYCGGGLLLIP